jgi:alpha-amylase
MKKLYKGLILVSLLMQLTSCFSGEFEMQIDTSLESKMINDNNRVYYEIFVGAFSDANGDGMGDLQGIINRLDYLNDGNPNSGKSLGIQGIWLMPIHRSTSYHKYDVIDYKSIDPKYGTIQDFEKLTASAKERGIDIIIDLVLNHTSNYHQWFLNAKEAVSKGDFENKYSKYYTLVTAETKESGKIYYPFVNGYFYEGNFSEQMPELNMDTPEVREEIIDIIKFWFDKGVHGFRLDAAKYVFLNDLEKNLEFWNWFMEEVRKIKPDAYVVAENWSSDVQILPFYNTFSNFDFGMSQSNGAIATTARGFDTVNAYVRYLNIYRNLVLRENPNAILTPFISNHDMNRAAGYLPLDDFSMHMAANLYILTFGTPFIYYGEEIGLLGSRGNERTDANRRLKMLWGDGDKVTNPIGSTFPDERQVNGTVRTQMRDSDSLYNHYKKLILIRNANPEIARGAYKAINFEGFYSFGGFLSTYENSTVGVFHNTGQEQIIIDLSQHVNFTFSSLRSYVGKGKATLSSQILTLDPMTSVILK